MTLCRAGVAAIVAVSLTTPLVADEPRTQVQVSVTVVRTCRVASGQPQVSLDCGSHPQVVRVVSDQGATADRAVTNQTTIAPEAAKVVTIHF